MIGASVFPRHWVYDAERRARAKAGLADFKQWYRKAFGKHSPWGDEDSPTFVTAVETALERDLADEDHARRREAGDPQRCKNGELLTEQGEAGRRGVPAARRRARDGGRRRTARRARTRRHRRRAGGARGRHPHVDVACAVTKVRVARLRADQLDLDALAEISPGPPARGAARLVRLLFAAACAGRRPVSGRTFDRVGGHTSCVAIAHDRTSVPDARARRGHRADHLASRLRRRAVRAARSCSPTCTGTTCRVCRSSGAADRDDAARRCSTMPAQGDARCVLAARMAPPHFPIGSDGLRGDWGFAALEPGIHSIEGFEVTALDIPTKAAARSATGCATATRAIAYIPDHCPPRT